MPDILLHPTMQKTLDSFVGDPPHGILITGPKGAGKKTIAKYLASNIVNSKINSKQIYINVLEEKKFISIDQIKQIKKLLKTVDNSYRVIIINDSELLSGDAQNSILKILEEPPAGVVFILTSSSPNKLFNTIISRVMTIKYIKPTEQQFLEYAKMYGISPADTNKFLVISKYKMGIFSSLCKGDEDYHLLHDIEKAKDILSETPKDRLIRIEQLSKDSDSAIKTLNAIVLVCDSALRASAKTGQHNKWLKKLRNTTDALDKIERSVSIKLVLTKLFLVL